MHCMALYFRDDVVAKNANCIRYSTYFVLRLDFVATREIIFEIEKVLFLISNL